MDWLPIIVLACALTLIGIGFLVGWIVSALQAKPTATQEEQPIGYAKSQPQILTKKQQLAYAIRRAKEHQQMHDGFEAYRDAVQYLRDKLCNLDDQWHRQAVDMEALNQLRGQKQALLDVLKSYENELNADLMALIEAYEALPEEE